MTMEETVTVENLKVDLVDLGHQLESVIIAEPPYEVIIAEKKGKKEVRMSREKLLEHALEFAVQKLYELTDTEGLTLSGKSEFRKDEKYLWHL